VLRRPQWANGDRAVAVTSTWQALLRSGEARSEGVENVAKSAEIE